VPKVTNAGIVATAVPGPRGPIQLAASPRGVVAIELLTPPAEFDAGLARRFGAAPRRVPAGVAADHLAAAVEAVGQHLAGVTDAFAGVPLDLDDRPAWDRAVLGAVRAVPWGATASYGGIAVAIGRRGAARAVGGSVGRNPISLAIPCHRIIAGDGSLGGYGGGWWGSRELRLDLKRELLALEGTVIGASGHIADNETVAQATRGHRRPR
jgi:methylated-DNA-[protein]-cysteine S-methyltransferase